VQTVALAELQEAVLQHAAGELGAEAPVLLEDCGEGGVAWAVARPRAVHRAAERREVDDPQVIGLAERLGEGVARYDVSEVDQRSLDRGHGDALDDGDIADIERDGVMDRDPAPTPHAPRGRHVDTAPAARSQAVERCRVAVAQHGTRSARQNGRKPMPLPSQLAMTHGVDPRVQRHERPAPQACLDHRRGRSERQQLAARDHPVLPLDQRHDSMLVDLHRHVRCRSTGIRGFAPL